MIKAICIIHIAFLCIMLTKWHNLLYNIIVKIKEIRGKK